MNDKEKISKLAEALFFYADPDTYFAIGFFPDPPCGGFMEDFSNDFGDQYGVDRDYNHVPGKFARKVLKEVGEI